MFKNLFIIRLTIIITIILTYILLRQSPINILSFNPKESLQIGNLEKNNFLKSTQIISSDFYSPESIIFDKKNNFYVGTKDGKIIRFDENAKKSQIFAETNGRPLGLAFDKKNNLIICDAIQGLLLIDSNKKVHVLATEANEIPFKYLNSVIIADNGIIYFTDSSYKFSQENAIYDILEAGPNGRLLSYNPQTKTVKTELINLYFANGLALSKNQDYLLITETSRYQIRKYWLKGNKNGISEIIINNLPGLPNNISLANNNYFWIALTTLRNPYLDLLHYNPSLKWLVSKIPFLIIPEGQSYGFVIQIDTYGSIVRSLQDPSGEWIHSIATAMEHKNNLYLTTLNSNKIGRFHLK